MKVVFAYVPVVHKQVLEFFTVHKDLPIWLLNNEIAKHENVYIERDARALPAGLIKIELLAHGFHDVTVIDPGELVKITGDTTLIVPEDEIIQFFVDRYVKGDVKIEIENIFIRWTQKLSTTEFEIPPGRTMTTEHMVKETITELESEAQKSEDWWRQIAAGVVKNGSLVVRTHNHHLPTAHSIAINGDPRSNLDAGQGPGIYTSIHAEAAAIAECARKGIVTEGADLFATTFPCPTCARSVVEAGFKRVFYKKGYSLLDAEEILQKAGVEIIMVAD